MVDRTFNRIFDRHDAIIGSASRDLIEHVPDIDLRGVIDRCPEFGARRLMRPSGFGTQIGNRQSFLQRKSSRHDLAIDGTYRGSRKPSLVLSLETLQKSFLSFGSIDRKTCLLLYDPDLVNKIRALI